MDRATLDAELPHSLNPLTNEHTNNNGHDGNSVTNVNDNKDGDDDNDNDDGAVDGPTVEAHVDLAKTACKYHASQHRFGDIPTDIYSAQCLSRRYCC